jgi:hypothetical protein
VVNEVHILTIAANLPTSLLDSVLTATEQALEELGVSKVWIISEGRNLRVVADVQFSCDDGLNGVAGPDCDW